MSKGWYDLKIILAFRLCLCFDIDKLEIPKEKLHSG